MKLSLHELTDAPDRMQAHDLGSVLARRGVSVPAAALERDFSQPCGANEGVEAAWLSIYRDTAALWDLYDLAENFVDLEFRFQ